MVNFMRAALNEQRKYRGEEQISASNFLKLMRDKRELLGIDSQLVSRSVNEGFSGGEKEEERDFSDGHAQSYVGYT